MDGFRVDCMGTRSTSPMNPHVFLGFPAAGELLKTEGMKPHVLLDSLKALVVLDDPESPRVSKPPRKLPGFWSFWKLKHVHMCLVWPNMELDEIQQIYIYKYTHIMHDQSWIHSNSIVHSEREDSGLQIDTSVLYAEETL